MTATPAPNPSVALGRVLVDELSRCGLTDLCLSPGSRSAPLAMAVAGDPRLRVHVRIDERSASFCALGLARVQGRPVAVLTTSGTAVANLHPAVLEADAAGVPLLLLTADRPPELRGTGANQTADQVKLFGQAVRWFADITAEDRPGAPQAWRSIAARAWAAAAGSGASRAGPVHLNVGFREPLVPEGDGFRAGLAGRPDGRPWTLVSTDPPAATATEAQWLAGLAVAHRRGLVVAGDLPRAPVAGVLAFAGAAGWPVIAEPTSGLRVPPALRTGALLADDPAFVRAHLPEVVVTVGRPVLSRAVLALLRAAGRHVVVSPYLDWADPERTASDVLAADPGSVGGLAAGLLGGAGDADWLAAWVAADERAAAAVDAVLDATDAVTEQRVARDLAAMVPGGSLLAVASSLPIRHLNLLMRPRAGLTVVANRGVSGIDGFVSTAVGAALAHSGPAWALLGDLALLHDQGGLHLAPGEPRPDLVLVVLDNGGGGIFHLLPQVRYPDSFERLFGTPHGRDLAAVAAAAGWDVTVLEQASALPAALDGAHSAGGLQLLLARTDRAATAALHDQLVRAVRDR